MISRALGTRSTGTPLSFGVRRLAADSLMNLAETLQTGCEILDPVLIQHGFHRLPVESGRGSGGAFSRTEYIRGNRRLALGFRYSLGDVVYHAGTTSLSHEAYMQAVLGRRGANQYPEFSEDPLDGFQHLRHDLERYCTEFLSGSDAEFAGVVEKAGEQSKRTGFKALSSE